VRDLNESSVADGDFQASRRGGDGSGGGGGYLVTAEHFWNRLFISSIVRLRQLIVSERRIPTQPNDVVFSVRSSRGDCTAVQREQQAIAGGRFDRNGHFRRLTGEHEDGREQRHDADGEQSTARQPRTVARRQQHRGTGCVVPGRS